MRNAGLYSLYVIPAEASEGERRAGIGTNHRSLRPDPGSNLRSDRDDGGRSWPAGGTPR